MNENDRREYERVFGSLRVLSDASLGSLLREVAFELTMRLDIASRAVQRAQVFEPPEDDRPF
jgi:hypothetical protein